MTPRAHRRHRGFTLIEVLIAMSIMAIVAIMSWQGVDGITRARAVTESHLNRLLRLNTVLAQFKQDLASLHDMQGSTPSFHYDGARITLVRDMPGGVQVVVWALRNEAWFRWTGPVVTGQRGLQDQWMNSRGLLGNEPAQLKAFTGISQIQIYCGHTGTVSNCQSSTGAPAPSATPASGVDQSPSMEPATPEYVQMVLTFAPDSGLSGSAMRSFLIKAL